MHSFFATRLSGARKTSPMSAHESSRSPPPEPASSGPCGCLHLSQRIRARRWATTASIDDATRNVSTSISTSRLIAEGASFVCKREHEVTGQGGLDRDRGRLLVRISPIRTMSGSARRIDRSAEANVSPALGLTWIWLTRPSGTRPDPPP